jgi:type II secretion system protein C
MILPESVSQGAKWALVIGLAFFSADATAAVIQRQLQVPPKALPQPSVGAIQESVPAQAPPPGLITLLKTTKPEADDEAAEQGSNGSVKPVPVKAPTNMTLRGTMAGGDGSGLAMIEVNGQTQVVGTGELISGMTVTAVTAYSVTLEAQGQIQVLEMDSGGQVVGLPTPSQPVAVATPEVTEPVSEPDADADSESVPEGGVEDAILTQRELRNILDNPAEFAGKGFRMKPVLKGGDIIGMRVNMRDQNHPLARLGVQNGDVVKSLNGTPINGPEALSSIYRVLRNTSNLSFEVERGGKDEKIEVTLEE